jgi:hypothetical protein
MPYGFLVLSRRSVFVQTCPLNASSRSTTIISSRLNPQSRLLVPGEFIIQRAEGKALHGIVGQVFNLPKKEPRMARMNADY